MITTRVKQDARLLIVTLQGLLGADELGAFLEKRQRAVHDAGFRDEAYGILYDASACSVLPRDVAAMFQNPDERSTPRPKRVAVVVNGALARLQARRIVKNPNAGYFSSFSEAFAWFGRGASPNSKNTPESTTEANLRNRL